jgi:hypothetical protein
MKMMNNTLKRKRIRKGVMVASTNPVNKILCKRFVVNVYFTTFNKVLKYDIQDQLQTN